MTHANMKAIELPDEHTKPYIVPSWFSEGEAGRNDDAMRDYRRRVEERIARARAKARAEWADENIKDADAEREQTEEANEPRTPWFRIIGVGVIGFTLGGGLGLLANRQTIATHGSGVLFATPKPVPMAQLRVDDASGAVGHMIPLSVAANEFGGGNAPVDVMISGLPTSAFLSAGHALDNGRWLVEAPKLRGLKLVVPKFDQAKLDLEVAAIAQGGDELMAPKQNMHVDLSKVIITPAGAPPEPQSPQVKK